MHANAPFHGLPPVATHCSARRCQALSGPCAPTSRCNRKNASHRKQKIATSALIAEELLQFWGPCPDQGAGVNARVAGMGKIRVRTDLWHHCLVPIQTVLSNFESFEDLQRLCNKLASCDGPASDGAPLPSGSMLQHSMHVSCRSRRRGVSMRHSALLRWGRCSHADRSRLRADHHRVRWFI